MLGVVIAMSSHYTKYHVWDIRPEKIPKLLKLNFTFDVLFRCVFTHYRFYAYALCA